jgi:hypothetical protein
LFEERHHHVGISTSLLLRDSDPTFCVLARTVKSITHFTFFLCKYKKLNYSSFEFSVSNPDGLLTDNLNQVAGIQDLREREVWNQQGIEKQGTERKIEFRRKMNSNLGEKDSVSNNFFDASSSILFLPLYSSLSSQLGLGLAVDDAYDGPWRRQAHVADIPLSLNCGLPSSRYH